MKLPKVIYIMGPPGAGKGTQAELLAEEIGYKQFSTGAAFRAVAAEDSARGKKVRDTIDNGFLMPPEDAAEIVIAAVREHLEQGEGLIFDGTPRTEKEAQLIDEFFVEKGYGESLPIFLALNKEEMMERNQKRVYCLGTRGGDFPVVSDEDKKKCKESGGKEGRRPDDEPEKFATRWSEFQEQTAPVIEKYRKQGILKEVDGMPAIEEVQKQVMGVINGFERSD